MFTSLLVHLVATLLTAAGPSPQPPAISTCPGGGRWYGHAPPHGYEYYCGIERDGKVVRHGWYVAFHASGSLQEACEYEEGELDGRCSQYDENGDVTHRGQYRGGIPVGYHWAWGVWIGDPDEPEEQRKFLEVFLTNLEVPPSDAPVLAQHLLDHHTIAVDDIRNAPQICGATHCVSAGVVDGEAVLAIQFGPSAQKVEDGAAAYRVGEARATRQKAAALGAARARKKKYERALEAYERKVRAWEYTRLRCNDGTRSPTCVCGGGHRGCCSHHGGVWGCPRDMPERPLPPED